MKPTFQLRSYLFIISLVFASLACNLGQSTPTDAPEMIPATQMPDAAAPAAPEPTDSPAIPLGEEIRMADQGFSFRPLPDYQLDTSFGAQMLAPDADPDTGPAFMLAGGLAYEGTTDVSLIDSLKSDEVTVDDPSAITVDGYEGLSADIARGGGELSGRVVAVMVTPQQQFVLFSMAPQAQWEAEIAPFFEAVLGSVRLFEMEEAADPASASANLTEIRQWAMGATASSEYGNPNWSAMQATGAPNVAACGDNSEAWAAASSSSVEWLELTFDVPVEPSQVNVYISYNPIHIVKMELIDLDGVSHQIYEFEARSYPECPTIFSVDVMEIGFQAQTLRITIDQSNAPSWVEIDAVELVGMGAASLVVDPPSEEPTPPAASFDTPDGFLWRTGGEKAFDTYAQFPGLWGMDVDANNGMIFVADAVYSIQVVGTAGEPIGAFQHDEMRVPQDVKVDAFGNVFVAAWGSGKVLAFEPMGGGEPFVSFGERGKGDGQFGDFSPTHLAVGLDGRIYVHDRNKNDKDETYNRILVFSPMGDWLQTINFEDDFFTPGGMDVGPDGNLYVVGFIGSNILKYSPDGELLGELGEDAIRSVVGGPQGIALDEAGNFYLALWTGGIVKLDPQGNLLGQWGVQVKVGENAWPEGGFYQPAGIAVLPDGSQVYFSDTSSKYAYLTAFSFVP